MYNERFSQINKSLQNHFSFSLKVQMVQGKMNLYPSLPIYNLIWTVLVAILFNRFSFRQSGITILLCIIFSIIALFLLVNVRFYTKNGGRLIYYIAQYKHFFTCCLDYLCFCKCLKLLG